MLFRSAAWATPALQSGLRAQGMEPVFIGSEALQPMIDAEAARYRMLAHRARIVVE